ncbi:hypothetical protein [Nocardia sp. NPDC006630]|uniref:hypothetical protein n=1 Tax=Nocardia sp. NPDC006630 TaxID=3157181 RepID=UPI0033AA2C38
MTEERTAATRLSDQSAGFRRSGEPRKHGGEGVEDGFNVSGMILLGLGVLAVALALVAAGYGFARWAVAGAIVSGVLIVSGIAVLVLEWRRRRTRAGLTPDVRQGH